MMSSPISMNHNATVGGLMANSTTATSWNLGIQRRDRKTWSVIKEQVDQDLKQLQLTTVELEEILKQLLSISMPNSRIRNEEIANMITSIAQILPISSGLLCSEFIRFIQKCSMKEKVWFTKEQMHLMVQFFLNFIKVCPSWYTASSIRALGMILHENAERATEDFELLFDVLLRYMDPSGVDIEARYAATSCVSNICTQAGKTQEVYHFFPKLLRMVVENFRQQSQSLMSGQTDRILVKACTCSMKCIYTIVNANYERISDRIENSLPSLLNSMRQVIGYGLVLDADREEELKFMYRDEIPSHDSDSSLCGSDSAGSAGSRSTSGEGLFARLRITVLYTLESIAQHFPKAVTSSIGLYLPEQTTPYMTLFGNAPSILTLLIADPCEKVRIASAKFLETCWEKMPLKQFFRHSNGLLTSTTSFASMPKRISHMLYQVHISLVYCLQNEPESTALAQVLKTTATVITNCPYKNVSVLLDKSDLHPPFADILKALASSLYMTATSLDHSVRMASLSCFSAFLNVQESIPAIAEWIVSRPNVVGASRLDTEVIEVAHIRISCGVSSHLGNRSFLEELITVATRQDESANSRALLRLEAMSLLSKIAKNYSSTMSMNWKSFSQFMLTAFQDPDPNVRLQAVKILENYIKGESTAKVEVQPVVTSGPLAGTSPGSLRTTNRWIHSVPNADGVPQNECLELMSTHLIRAFHDTSHHVRASVCACFTLLRSKDWVKFKQSNPKNFSNYIKVFLRTPLDSSPVVRAAGFRLLGSLCLAPTFKTPSFASSIARLAIDALEDTTLNVRVRAAWALGNVCTTQGPESMVPVGGSISTDLEDEDSKLEYGIRKMSQSSTDESILLYELLDVATLRTVIEKMLIYINDNDKVASSVARTLGLVCRWIFYQPFRGILSPKDLCKMEDLLGQTMSILSAKINNGSPKVRWNACHAIAKILLCPNLPLASATWAPTVFHALISAMAQQENFKVRISASSALRVSSSRSAYGTFFQPALHATIDALETASDLKDVTEFKYKEQLETQLSFTLVHLLHVATEDDDLLIWNEINAKSTGFLYDWLFHNLHRMYSAIESSSVGASENISEDAIGHRTRRGSSISEPPGSMGGTDTDVHDVNPIKKDEILSAVRTLLRILQKHDHQRLYSTSCLSILYDTKLSLERDVFYSNEDIDFEF